MTHEPQPPSEPTESIPFNEIGGWPATIGNRRLMRALNHLRGENEIPAEDPQMEDDVDMFMLTVAIHHYPATLEDRLSALPDNPSEQMEGLTNIAKDTESDQTFGGLMFETHDQNTEFLELKYIFALIRHPEWMGASTYLTSLKDMRITVFESTTRPGQTGFFIAAPFNKTDPYPQEGEFPEGEPDLLRTIAMWHQATSCHWIPRNNDGNSQPGPGPRPTLELAIR